MNCYVSLLDVDECEADPIPCHSETEVCSNLVGTYVCNCVDELVRGVDGECVTKEERRRQKYSKKEKKKKKRRIRKGNLMEEEVRRTHYPWYYTLAPLVVTFLIYKYWRPNLVTSVGIILFICVSATLVPSGLTAP